MPIGVEGITLVWGGLRLLSTCQFDNYYLFFGSFTFEQ
jgi:hypothetical protein